MTNEGNPEKEKRRRRRFFPSQLQALVTTPLGVGARLLPLPFPFPASRLFDELLAWLN